MPTPGPTACRTIPVIASAVNGATTTVDFSLDGGAGSFLIQFFRGSVCGAAEQLVGSTAVASGNTVFDLGVLVPAGAWITATATDAAGSTSELSPCVQVSGVAPAAIASVSPASQVAPDQMLTIRGSGLPAVTAGDVLFQQGASEWPASYLWWAHPTDLIARLPTGVLVPGPATVRVKNPGGTVFSAPFPITISAAPGAPVLVQLTDGCNSGPSISSVTGGQLVSVNADGIDTTGTTLVWSGPPAVGDDGAFIHDRREQLRDRVLHRASADARSLGAFSDHDRGRDHERGEQFAGDHRDRAGPSAGRDGREQPRVE